MEREYSISINGYQIQTRLKVSTCKFLTRRKKRPEKS
jgi:hypothetical protein